MRDSSEYDIASGYLYEGAAKWGNELTETIDAWSDSVQSTPTWQDNDLPDGSSELMNQGSRVHNTDTEDAAPESDINQEGVGLMIEEDDMEESELGNSSSSSTEGI